MLSTFLYFHKGLMHVSKYVLLFVAGFFLSVVTTTAQQGKKPFTVADDIGFVHFGHAYTDLADPVQFSPDGNYLFVDAARGRLDLNCIEDSLRFYRSRDIRDFLKHPDRSEPPAPFWVVTFSADEESLENWHWLADSSAVAFLERTASGGKRLVLADFRKKEIEPLTAAAETVDAFDIRDRSHYVYTLSEPVGREKTQAERKAPVIVGTGRNLFDLIFPDDPLTIQRSPRKQRLWAVVDGKRFEVQHDGVPIRPYGFPYGLALSPDGRVLATQVTVPDVPKSWETLYPPPFASDPYNNIHAGQGGVRQYVLIDLKTGTPQTLTDAPISFAAGQWAYVFLDAASWSNDGQAVLLPGTFLKSKDNTPSRPCVAVVDLPSKTGACVELLKGVTEGGGREAGFHYVSKVRFVEGDKERILVIFDKTSAGDVGATEYRRATDKTWQVVSESKGDPPVVYNGLEITIKQGPDQRPQLIAAEKEASRLLWDPNPQFKEVEFGEASIYHWKDIKDREWRGVLYKPSNYRAGRRYPLVIQTHGFEENQFFPSGLYPTAFAARALAGAGMLVLQVAEHTSVVVETPAEGPWAVSSYEAAVNQLQSEGLVDPDRIGIIGFSRTCFYVVETLTTSSLHLRAASITDGVMETYSQYLLHPERPLKETNAIIGAPPFGEGLQLWLKRSPSFKLDKITVPLLVVGNGPSSLLNMWEPYAVLYHLRRPVDLMMLNTDEHVLTNPAVRMASQGGTVDWFRFWLKDEEDPDPAKVEQYARWRELRKLQEQNARQSQQPNPPSAH